MIKLTAKAGLVGTVPISVYQAPRAFRLSDIGVRIYATSNCNGGGPGADGDCNNNGTGPGGDCNGSGTSSCGTNGP